MMKQMKLPSILFLLLSVCFVAASCGKKNEIENSLPDSPAPSTSAPSTSAPSTSAPSSSATAESVAGLLEDLETEKAAPSEFIKLAKEHVETADEDTARLLIQAIFKAQKDYPAQIAAAYETANADADFSALYALDVTPDLTAKITNEDIAKTVEESYANGFKLNKLEGYIFPIIDLDIYEAFFFSHLSEADAASLKKDIEAFNNTL